MTAKKLCFVISPIGDPSSAIRAEADWFLKGIVRPALEANFKILRADDFAATDVITNKIITTIKDSDLIVADLTGHNPNVFYELAVAHAFERPVIPMIRSDQTLPFDNQAMGTIFYSRERFEIFEAAKVALERAAVEAAESSYKASNPITLALGMGKLKISGDDRDAIVASLKEAVDSLEHDVSYLRHRTAPLMSFRANPLVDPSRESTRKRLSQILSDFYKEDYTDLPRTQRSRVLSQFEDDVLTYGSTIGRDLAPEEAKERAAILFGFPDEQRPSFALDSSRGKREKA